MSRAIFGLLFVFLILSSCVELAYQPNYIISESVDEEKMPVKTDDDKQEVR